MSPVLPVSIKRPVIKRKHLRKYSWLPDVFRIKGSIIPRIIGPVLTVTIWAALVAYADRQGVKFVFTNSVLPLLSVVVGLILVFRNGTSYDRFWEGRKCFAAVTSHIRNLSRLVWVGVGVPPSGNDPVGIKGPTPVTSATEEQLRKRKEYVLRLLLSFAYATRHYLRGEDGDHYADYHGVLPASFRQRYSAHNGYASTHNSSSGNSSTNASQTLAESDTPQKKTCPLEANNNTNNSGLHKRTNDATKRIRPKRSKGHLNRHTKDASQDATTPLLSAPPAEFAARFPHASMPFPLIIAHELSRQIYLFRRDGFLETIGPAGLNSMSMTVQGLSDQLTAMERIANTPIPHSYGIHLKQCVTLYLFALPFTLVGDFGWGTVPVATVVAFTFMGIEGIATEIEQPFGDETTDLPLDRYCSDLREEIEYMVEKLPEGGPGGYGYDDGEGDD